MKTFIALTIFTLISVSTFGQVGLKGINLGEKGVDSERIKQTVGGIEGVIIPRTIDDGRIYRVTFMPREKIYQSDLDELLNGLEDHFGVVFVFKLKASSPDIRSGTYMANFNKDGHDYSINVRILDSGYQGPPIIMFLSILDKELYKISAEAEQKKANSDF